MYFKGSHTCNYIDSLHCCQHLVMRRHVQHYLFILDIFYSLLLMSLSLALESKLQIGKLFLSIFIGSFISSSSKSNNKSNELKMSNSR